MKIAIIDYNTIPVRKTNSRPGSYHRDKKQEERKGTSKHPKKSFNDYMKEF